MMKRLFYCFTASVLMILSTGCSHQSQESQGVQTVRIDTALTASEQTTLQYPGKVRAAQDISLSFRVSGTISKFLVNDGQRVSQGQLLVQMDPTDYQVQLDATEAEYQQIKAEAERVMALYKDNGTTPNANDKAVYGLQQITAKRKHHQDQLAYTQLRAPFSGYVQKRLFEAHETVAAGMPVLSMVSAGIPEVEINLPAAEYIRRSQFDRYHCTFDIYPGQTFPLKLISITTKANANQLYTMRLQLEAGQQPLPSPGMNTMVTIFCHTDSDDALTVPTGSLLHEDGKTYVFVYSPESQTVSRHEVKTLRLLNNGRTMVTSTEVKSGDLIIASGAHHIEDGETVKPLPAATETNVGGLL